MFGGVDVQRVVIEKKHVLRSAAERLRHVLKGVGIGFGTALLRAIFAGWLIALTVWLLPVAESSRVSIIIILTYLIGVGSFNHVIAGSTKMFYLIVTGNLTWGAYATGFFIPTLLGNIIGGVSLVAFLGHAQVVAGKET